MPFGFEPRERLIGHMQVQVLFVAPFQMRVYRHSFLNWRTVTDQCGFESLLPYQMLHEGHREPGPWNVGLKAAII